MKPNHPPKGKIGIYLSHIRNSSGSFEILQLLENEIDTRHPEQGDIPVKLLGFGEISIVFEILTPDTAGWAFKRLPIFESASQVNRHIAAYNKYHQILVNKIGLRVPSSDTAWVYSDESQKKISLYCIQQKVRPSMVGNQLIHQLDNPQIHNLILKILNEMHKVWDFNRKADNENLQVGLDGQISNWAIINSSSPDYLESDENHHKSHQSWQISSETKLTYLDTSTPMYRINGEDAMEGKLFLKSAPSFLRWILQPLLREVLDRYYSWRDVLIDLVANFYKEQRQDLIPDLINWINDYLKGEAATFHLEPLTEQEVKKYYKHDKFIWVLFQRLRKFDRFLKTKILRQKYDFYLPKKIKR